MRTFLIILEVLLAVVLIASVLLQPSKSQGFNGIISSGGDTFFSKNKSKTRESMLVKVTIISAVLFAGVIIVLNRIH